MAVAEVTTKSVPEGFNIDGGWMFDGKKIIPAPVDHIARAEANKQSLLQLAAQSIAPLQDAVELELASEEEIALLKGVPLQSAVYTAAMMLVGDNLNGIKGMIHDIEPNAGA